VARVLAVFIFSIVHFVNRVFVEKNVAYARNINSRKFAIVARLRISLFEYVDGFYNPKRPHSTIDFLSSDDF